MGSKVIAARRATALVLALVMVVLALPAGASGTRALSLRAAADNQQGHALGLGGSHQTITTSTGWNVEVDMPPQIDPMVKRREGGSLYVMDSLAVVRRDEIEDRAEGSMADGTATASSSTQDLYIKAADTVITVDRLTAISQTDCEGAATAESASAGSAVVGLRVNGEPVEVTGPNQAGQRFEGPDPRTFVEVQALQVEPDAAGNGWTTTGLLVRVHTVTPNPPPVTPSELLVTNELAFGVATTSVECAA